MGGVLRGGIFLEVIFLEEVGEIFKGEFFEWEFSVGTFPRTVLYNARKIRNQGECLKKCLTDLFANRIFRPNFGIVMSDDCRNKRDQLHQLIKKNALLGAYWVYLMALSR